jgi:hypothetical protein
MMKRGQAADPAAPERNVVSECWLLNDMFAFENVGFCRDVQDLGSPVKVSGRGSRLDGNACVRVWLVVSTVMSGCCFSDCSFEREDRCLCWLHDDDSLSLSRLSLSLSLCLPLSLTPSLSLFIC